MQVGIALLHHLLETATMQVPVLDSFGMPIPGETKVHRSSSCKVLSALKLSTLSGCSERACSMHMVRKQGSFVVPILFMFPGNTYNLLCRKSLSAGWRLTKSILAMISIPGKDNHTRAPAQISSYLHTSA